MQNSRIYSQLIDAIESQTPCVLASVIRTQNSTSATVGDKAIIDSKGEMTGWIGGGCCQAVVKKVAPLLLKEAILKENRHTLIRICPENEFVDGMDCYPSHCPSEGTIDIFLEPIANQATLRLYGNTPIANSIARYSEELNIHLEWRPLLEQYTQNPVKQQVAIAIIATQGQGDLAALQQALADNAEHILLVASHKKAAALTEKLQQLDVCPKKIATITAPAGIDIGAVSSAEIALSIMANVISLKRQPSFSNPTNSSLPNTTPESAPLQAKMVSPSKVPSSCCKG